MNTISTFRFFSLVIILSFCVNLSNATIIYVDLGANGVDDGTSWTNAYPKIQDAITASVPGDEIWVAEGTYYTSYINDRNDFFFIDKAISLYGGFIGNETDPSQRILDGSNSSTLSGDIGGLVLDDNAISLLKIFDTNGVLTIDGFNISGGYNQVSGVNNVISIAQSDVIISHCKILDNHTSYFYEDMLRITESNVSFYDCLFLRNSSNDIVYSCQNFSTVNIYGCTFSKNTAPFLFYSFPNNTLNLYNTIAYGNLTLFHPNNINEAHNCILEDDVSGVIDPISVSSENPLFAEPLFGDYSLEENSPAIDNGSITYVQTIADLGGNLRIIGDSIDIGCYEYRIPTILKVDGSASGLNNGSSWANAFNKLEDALFFAEDDDEIWVANGVYKPTEGTDRSIHYVIDKKVKIYGGFVGGEVSLEDRDWSLNSTILSGGIGSQTDVTDNSRKLFSFNDITGLAVIDGFKFQRCYSDLFEENFTFENCNNVRVKNCEFNLNYSGSSICSINESNVNFANCLFRDNESFLTVVFSSVDSEVDIYNTTLVQNESAQVFQTSGIMNVYNIISYDNTTTLDEDLTFATNSIIESGSVGITTAVGISSADPLFINSSTNDFQLQSSSPGIDFGSNDYITTLFDLNGILRVFGGAIDAGCYEHRSTSEFKVDKNAIGLNNGSTWNNAFLKLEDALYYAEDGDEIWVANGVYKPTDGTDQSIQYLIDKSIKIYGGFAGNEINLEDRNWDINSTILSGGIGSQTDVTDNSNTLFTFADISGIAVIDGFKFQRCNSNGLVNNFNFENSNLVRVRNSEFNMNDSGFAICAILTSDVTFENCLFRDNNAQSPVFYGGADSEVEIYNSTISQNEGTKVFQTLGIMNVYNSIAYANTTTNTEILTYAQASVIESGTDGIASYLGVFIEDPLFGNPGNNNFQLQEGSSAIGLGSNTLVYLDFDLLHNDRIQNQSVDAGCYESTYQRFGCTDNTSCNYDQKAEMDDGSCSYPGCTDPAACNYSSLNGCDDGSCVQPDGCTDPIACNYDLSALCDDGSCTFAPCYSCEGDANNDGYVNILDMLAVSSNFGCTSGCLIGDANGNDNVNIIDLLSVSSNFGNVCD